MKGEKKTDITCERGFKTKKIGQGRGGKTWRRRERKRKARTDTSTERSFPRGTGGMEEKVQIHQRGRENLKPTKKERHGGRKRGLRRKIGSEPGNGNIRRTGIKGKGDPPRSHWEGQRGVKKRELKNGTANIRTIGRIKSQLEAMGGKKGGGDWPSEGNFRAKGKLKSPVE